jgi:hypothetical protein
MTIALGLLASDGIVIAADTQESTGDYMKGDQSKLMSFASMQAGKPEVGSLAGACVISGAGDSGYVRALTIELGSVFLANQDTVAINVGAQESLQCKFQECLRKFYKEHVIPFASFPFKDRPDVEMLLGIYRRFGLSLFVTERTLVNMVVPYKAIGMGYVFAELLLKKLYRRATVQQLELLAAYIVFMTKESVETCGKYTQITTIHGARMLETPEGAKMLPPLHSISHTPWEKIDNWERSFRTEWWQAEHAAIWTLIDRESSPNVKRSAARKSAGRR